MQMIKHKQAYFSWRSRQPLYKTTSQKLGVLRHNICNHAVRERKNFGPDMEAAREYLHSKPQAAGPIAGLLNFLSNNAFGAGRVRDTAAGAACWAHAEMAWYLLTVPKACSTTFHIIQLHPMHTDID